MFIARLLPFKITLKMQKQNQVNYLILRFLIIFLIGCFSMVALLYIRATVDVFL
jgi:hypothetical protein